MGKISLQNTESKPRKSVLKLVIPILSIVVIVGSIGLFWWYTQIVPAQQYAMYSKYGFSFQYPLDMTVSDQGATDDSGMVVCELKNDGHELVAVSWLRTLVAPDLEASLYKGLKEMAEMGCVTEFSKGNLAETTKAENRMIYQNFTMVSSGEKLFGVYGVWYCGTNQRFYQLYVYYGQENVLPMFQRYIDSFICD